MIEPATPAPEWTEFAVVPRGYDRGQVDEHLRMLAEQVTVWRVGYQHQQRRADSAEGQLHRARTELERRSTAGAEAGEAGGCSQARGFGYRVEKLLRAAEHEAGEVRSAATREATALLDRMRGQAEARRHEMEQSLISRADALHQQAALRRVELDERERRIAEHTAAAQNEVERMFSQARQQCDQLRLEARARAERERAAAQDAIRERRSSAEQELGRLHRLHDQVRDQLARLLDSLAGEFEAATPQPDPPPPARAQSVEVVQPPPRPARTPTGPEHPRHPQLYPRSGRGGPVPYQKNTDQAPAGTDWFDTPPSEAVTNDELMK